MKLISWYTGTLSLASDTAFGFASESLGVGIGTVTALWYLAVVIRAVVPRNDVRDRNELDL